MNKELASAPTARSWRDIPQPVKPRAMSSGGRWRLLAATMRATIAIATTGVFGWGGWLVISALRASPSMMPAAARAVPIRKFELRTSGDGVLNRDPTWLKRTLDLPAHASLMEVDLLEMKERILADGQVLTANVARGFPDTLIVTVTERTPLARVMAATDSGPRRFLVGQDGTIFSGTGFNEVALESLPWLDGVTLTRHGRRFAPLAGMPLLRELITAVRLHADHIYAKWHVVSLERLGADREIVVRTQSPVPMTIIFRADEREDRFQRELQFVDQIVKLDYLWPDLVGRLDQQVRVDLSLGRQVPVKIEPIASPGPAGTTTFLEPSVQRPWIQREL